LIQVDNSRCHTWLDLQLPDNVILIFQLPTQPEFNSGWKAAWSEKRSDVVKMPSAPPYSPELNPIERLWQEIKKPLKWEFFPDLDDLRRRLSKILSKLSSQVITQVTGWDFILNALFVANI